MPQEALLLLGSFARLLLPHHRPFLFRDRIGHISTRHLNDRLELLRANLQASAAPYAAVLIDHVDLALAALDAVDRALLSADHTRLAFLRVDIVRDDIAEDLLYFFGGV